MTSNKDTAQVKAAAYQACKAAGVLRFGRLPVGSRHPDRRKEASRRACRGRHK